MKDKDRSSHKKVTGPKGTPSAKRGASAGARKAGSGPQTEAAQIAARFRAVFESSRDAIGVSKAGIHVFVNPAYLELFGFPRGTDLAGKPVLDLIAPESRDQIKVYVRRRLQGEDSPSTYVTRGLRTDGSAFDMEVSVSPYQENGEDHTLVILRDITRRKMEEEEIAERGAMVQQIMDTASVAIFLVDRSGRILHANKRMSEMFRCSMEELAGSEYVDHVHPSEREEGRGKMLALLASEIPSVDLERLYWRKDGTQFWGHLAGRRFHDVQGNELGLIGVITDITARMRSEDLVRASEKKFSAIFDLIPDPTTITDIETGRIIGLNDAAARWFGRSCDATIGMSTADVQVWEDLSDRDRMLQVIRSKGEINDMEFRLRMHTGEIRSVLFSSRVLELEGKRCLLSRVHDITEREKMEEVLRISEEKFRKVFLTSPDAISINRLQDGMCVSINDGFTTITGYTPDDIIGRTPLELDIWVDPADRDKMVGGLQKQGEVKNLEAHFRTKDARIIDGLMSASIIEIDHSVYSVTVTRDITERKRSELALKQSEAKYRRLYNETPVLLHSIDRDARIVDVNDYWLKTMGYDRSEVIGRKVTDFFTDASRKYAQEIVQPAFFRDGIVKEAAYQFIKKNGDVMNVLLSAVAERDASGNVVRSQAVIEDITERKRTETALRESEERFKAITLTASDAILLMDDRGKIVYWNPAAVGMFGYSAEEAIGKDLHLFLGPEGLHDNFKKGFGNFVTTGQGPVINKSIELAAHRKDRTEFPIEVSTSAMNIGGRWHALGIIRDISDRKQAELEIREKEEKYRVLFETANDGIFIQDATGFVDCNSKGAEMYGLPKEMIIGRSPIEFSPERQPDGRPSSEVAGERIRSALNGIPQVFEWQPLRADGSPFDVEITLNRIELGGSVYLQSIVRDISERKRAEHALRTSELRFRSIIEHATAGILVADYETRGFLYANPEICRMLGYSRDELLAIDVTAIHPAEELPRVIKTFIAREGLQTACRRKDGTMLPVEIRTVAMEMDGRQCLVGFFVDMTERRLLEDERLKTQKLESIGTLAGGIAHDFNNLLQGVFGYISMAKLTFDQKEKSLAMLAQAEKALHQSVNLTSQLLTFSKGGKPVKKVLDSAGGDRELGSLRPERFAHHL